MTSRDPGDARAGLLWFAWPAGDGDEAPLCARVIKRQGDRVSVQIQPGADSAAVV